MSALSMLRMLLRGVVLATALALSVPAATAADAAQTNTAQTNTAQTNAAQANTSQDLRPFDANSLKTILDAHSGKPFVLALWSIYCAPCRKEMAYWNEFRRKYPSVPIVLVSTDTPNEWANVRRFLTQYDPGPVENWAFADEYVERVRYSIDKKWRGELPRAYFYDAKHVPVAHTGLLDVGWMNDWFAQQAKAK